MSRQTSRPMSSYNALIWVSDPLQARYLELHFRAADFQVGICSSYQNLQKSAQALGPRPIALVLNLAHAPEITYKQLHSLHQKLPLACLLVLSPHQNSAFQLATLAAGADDCLIQPIAVAELIGRARARLQRAQTLLQASLQTLEPEVLHFGPLQLEPGSRVALLAAQRVQLTATEFRLLHLLARHANSRLPRAQVYQLLWQEPEPPGSRRLDNFLFALRKKLPTVAGVELVSYYSEGICLQFAKE